MPSEGKRPGLNGYKDQLDNRFYQRAGLNGIDRVIENIAHGYPMECDDL